MALLKDDLKDDIRAALQDAKDNGWTLTQVAEAWANAIHAYVSAAEVQGITSDVLVSVPLTGPSPATGTGTATQTGTVTIQ